MGARLLLASAIAVLTSGACSAGSCNEVTSGADADAPEGCPSTPPYGGRCPSPGMTCGYAVNSDTCANGGVCAGHGWTCNSMGCEEIDGGQVCTAFECDCDSTGTWSCAFSSCSPCTDLCPCLPPATGTPTTCVTTNCDYGGGTTADCVCGQWVCTGPSCPPLPYGTPDAAPPCLDASGDAVGDLGVDSPLDAGSDVASDAAEGGG